MEYVFCCIYYRILERIGRNELIKDYLLLVGFDLVKNKFYCTYYKSSGGFFIDFVNMINEDLLYSSNILPMCIFVMPCNTVYRFLHVPISHKCINIRSLANNERIPQTSNKN